MCTTALRSIQKCHFEWFLKPHLVGRTARPEDHSFPWSCSGDTVPFHCASGLQKTGVEIRQNQVVQGDQETRKGASEGYACILGKKKRDF